MRKISGFERMRLQGLLKERHREAFALNMTRAGQAKNLSQRLPGGERGWQVKVKDGGL